MLTCKNRVILLLQKLRQKSDVSGSVGRQAFGSGGNRPDGVDAYDPLTVQPPAGISPHYS